MTWRQCFVLFLAIWVCTNRQESFYYIYPHHNVLLKNERHSRLINIQYFFTFYSSGIYTFIQYNCNFFQLKIFLSPQSSQVSSSTYSVDKISHWRKNLPYYDQHLQMWVETFPWRSQNCILPKVSQCRKMSHYAEKRYYQSYYIADLISCFYFLSLFPIFILWRSYSISWYISRHSFPYLYTLRQVVCQSESSMKCQSELRINYSGGG